MKINFNLTFYSKKKKKSTLDKFSIMTFNILCSNYASAQTYPYCPSWALNWEYRKEKILDELFKFKTDIICLQEVEADQFEMFFKVKLQRQGYQGVFCPKSRARTMSDPRGVDGSAIFFRESKFFFFQNFNFSRIKVFYFKKNFNFILILFIN